MAKLNSKWFTEDKTESEKEETRKLLSLCKPVLDKLGKMCYNNLESTRTEMRAKTTYDKPDWAAYQAHLNGYEQAYLEIIKLIDSIEER